MKDHPWLDGPAGNVHGIGSQFFADYARVNHLELRQGGTCGLVQDFSQLRLRSDVAVAAAVRRFYEHTSEYEIDAWSEWCGFFRPFGHALAFLFSRRLQQLNVPLSPLDSSKGMSSVVLPLFDPASKTVWQTAWVRELHATKNTLYAGSYSICNVPGYGLPCVKVVFPLPNGNAVVLMKPEVYHDGSFSVTSAGRNFGDPGFYFVVHLGDGFAYVRYVRTLKETIRVYPAEGDACRADHVLWIWGIQFLRLHYRMRLASNPEVARAS